MVSQLLFLLFSLGLLLPAGAQPTAIQELYVKPTEDTSCPEPCHTLDEYVQNATQYFVSNTAFKFLPGTHSLSQSLSVSGVSNLATVGINASVDINCIVSNRTISFTEISNLSLENLTLTSCVLNLTDLLNFNLLRVSMVHAYVNMVSPTLNAVNILGTSSFIELYMAGNFSLPHYITVSVHYTDNTIWSPASYSQLSIINSSFPEIFLETNLHQSTYNVSVLLNDLKFYGLYAKVIISIQSVAPNTLSLNNSRFNECGDKTLMVKDNIDLTTSTTWLSSTSVYIDNCMSLGIIQLYVTSTQVTFENSVVQHVDVPIGSLPNVMDAIGLRKPSVIKNVTFADTLITQNDGSNFYDVRYSTIIVYNTSNLEFTDCKFFNNAGGGTTFLDGVSVVTLVESENISFTDCEFSDNLGTAISAVNSRYTLSGSNSFSNNSAYKGGAMTFHGQSYVRFSDSSDILFTNNSADTVGGAIYVEFERYKQIPRCFFRGDICGREIPFSLRFDGNSAENGGGRVYGALFDMCTILEDCIALGWRYTSKLFNFDPRNTSDISAITSDPHRACLCEDGRPSCTTVFSNRTHYPGETFHLSAVVVGDRFGTVDGSVYAQILPANDGVAKLGSLERNQRVQHLKCSKLSYTIFSDRSAVTLALTASSSAIRQYPSDDVISTVDMQSLVYEHDGQVLPLLASSPVYINVTLLPCPPGFVLSGEPPSCICDTQLQDHNIPCNLTTQTVQRSGTEWVNASFHSNDSSEVIVSQYCPNNYCKPETVDVNLEDPDTQCAFNHSGILCGGCQSGLSRALGSAQCLHCSNAYLSLLIPFALAGFVLVFFIKLLNLTVAQGTINGLIFYANIVRANQDEWIPSHDQNILTVFIAWFNLDLGIETCFFDGLDAYWATWLQFVFPFYIWAIAILIIILSHYFSTAAKIFGNNSVPTLATLFLLSYPKLLRTIISVFHFSILEHPDGGSERVWSYDGNEPYFKLEFTFLFLVSMAVVLFLWLPYTATLTFAQWLQRSSNERVGKVLFRLKPFLDAYFGPLKVKHRYWVGLLLLVRGILFIIFAITRTRDSEADLLTTLVVVLCAITYLHYIDVYNNSYLTLLESSFLLNLGVLAGGTLYVQLAMGSQSALAYTCLSIAFVQFIVIVVIHGIRRLKNIQLVRKLYQLVTPAKPQAANQTKESDRLISEPVSERAVTTQELKISYSDFREPVLGYLDSQS